MSNEEHAEEKAIAEELIHRYMRETGKDLRNLALGRLEREHRGLNLRGRCPREFDTLQRMITEALVREKRS